MAEEGATYVEELCGMRRNNPGRVFEQLLDAGSMDLDLLVVDLVGGRRRTRAVGRKVQQHHRALLHDEGKKKGRNDIAERRQGRPQLVEREGGADCCDVRRVSSAAKVNNSCAWRAGGERSCRAGAVCEGPDRGWLSCLVTCPQ